MKRHLRNIVFLTIKYIDKNANGDINVLQFYIIS